MSWELSNDDPEGTLLTTLQTAEIDAPKGHPDERAEGFPAPRASRDDGGAPPTPPSRTPCASAQIEAADRAAPCRISHARAVSRCIEHVANRLCNGLELDGDRGRTGLRVQRSGTRGRWAAAQGEFRMAYFASAARRRTGRTGRS